MIRCASTATFGLRRPALGSPVVQLHQSRSLPRHHPHPQNKASKRGREGRGGMEGAYEERETGEDSRGSKDACRRAHTSSPSRRPEPASGTDRPTAPLQPSPAPPGPPGRPSKKPRCSAAARAGYSPAGLRHANASDPAASSARGTGWVGCGDGGCARRAEARPPGQAAQQPQLHPAGVCLCLCICPSAGFLPALAFALPLLAGGTPLPVNPSGAVETARMTANSGRLGWALTGRLGAQAGHDITPNVAARPGLHASSGFRGLGSSGPGPRRPSLDALYTLPLRQPASSGRADKSLRSARNMK